MKHLPAWCAALAIGCGSQLTASPEDYAAYRKTRLAEDTEARLLASEHYLREHPTGRWAAEVRAWFERAEPAFFTKHKGSRAGLEHYLDTLPGGPHAARAAERLAELDLARRYAAAREERYDEEARALVEKLGDADRLRRDVVRTVGHWTTHLASIRSWGGRTSDLPHQLIHDYRVAAPAAGCDAQRCIKSLSLPYAIPDRGRLTARSAVVDVVLELERAAVVGARLGGPELWSRVGEAAGLDAVRPGDAQRRAEAIGRSVTVVAGALEAHLPAQRCGREAVGTTVLVRECDGVRVEMIAAPTPEEDDRVEFRPVAKAQSP